MMRRYTEKHYQDYIIGFTLLAVVLIAAPVAGQLSETELGGLNIQASSFFSQANHLMKSDPDEARALYDKAIMRYQKMIDEGQVENVYLYYNMANAYLMKNDLGRAILHYRRGERLDPTYTDLLKNLNYARMQQKDHIPVSTEKKILQTLFFWHYDLGQQVKFILVTALWVGLCLVVTLKLWIRKLLLGRFLMFIFAVGLAAFSASLVVDVLQAQGDVQGVILAKSVIARQGDSENYPPSFEQPLHCGTEFKVLQERTQWLHIELANGIDTWIQREYVELI